MHCSLTHNTSKENGDTTRPSCPLPSSAHPISKRFRIALFSEGDVRIENGQSYAVSRGSDHAQPDKAKQRNQAVMLLEIFGRQMLGHFHAHQQRHGGETGARIEDCDFERIGLIYTAVIITRKF